MLHQPAQTSASNGTVLPHTGQTHERAPTPATPKRSPSAATLAKYAAHWAAFRAWCLEQRCLPLPAAPELVGRYVAQRAERLGAASLRVLLAALAYHHRQAGQLWDSGAPRSPARPRKNPQRHAAALTAAELYRVLDSCGDDLAGRRDRALLLLAFATGLRRSELVALDHADIRFTTGGMVVRVRRRSPGQPEWHSEQSVAPTPRPELCPVRALQAWLHQAGIEYGPILRRLTAAGTIEGRLTGNGVWKILRARAQRAGLTLPAGRTLSPHALRAAHRHATTLRAKKPVRRRTPGPTAPARGR